MPLPVAHSLAGYVIAEATNVRLTNKKWLNVAIFAALANLPDIDYLPGFLLGHPNRFHHWWVHSLGFALFVGLLGGFIFWQLQRKAESRRFWTYAAMIGAAVFSHCVLDLFTVDSSPPYGMLLLWPFDQNFYDVSRDIFQAVHKSDDSSTFFRSLLHWHNLKVAFWEFLIMAPILGLVKMIQRWRRSPKLPRAADLQNTQVAKLGLLEVSPLPSELAQQRSLTSLVEAAEQDEPDK